MALMSWLVVFALVMAVFLLPVLSEGRCGGASGGSAAVCGLIWQAPRAFVPLSDFIAPILLAIVNMEYCTKFWCLFCA